MNDLTPLLITGHGQIKKMVLPARWVEGPVQERPFDVQSLRWFHPPDDDQPRLCFFDRGYPIDEAAGEAFSDLLNAWSLKLSAEELWPLQEVLREAVPGEYFELKNASTGRLKGKRILLVEGKYVDRGWNTYSVFVDVDGTGCIVQELYYTAPQERYDEFLTAAMESMRTIEWEKPRVIDPATRATEMWLVDISELEPLDIEQEGEPEPPPEQRQLPATGDEIDLTALTRLRFEP